MDSTGYPNRSHRRRAPRGSKPRGEVIKNEALDLQGLLGGGDSWTRTNDPIDVNDVLYRLSHATLYIFYDAYATFSRTIRPRQSGGI